MAIIPDMTTGIIDFIISSGLITAIAAIPVPDFAVPYAAPNAICHTYTTSSAINILKLSKRHEIIYLKNKV